MESDPTLLRVNRLLETGQAEGAAEMARAALADESDAGRSVRLMVALADALAVLGDAAGSLNVLARAELVLGGGTGPAAAEIARRIARVHLMGQRRLRGGAPSQDADARAAAERLLSIARTMVDPALRSEAEALLSLADGMAGRLERARTHATAAEEGARGAIRRFPADLPVLVATAWWMAEGPERALAVLERLGGEGPEDRSIRAAARFDLGDVEGAGRDAALAWDGASPPRGLEAVGPLLVWPSTDPRRAAAGTATVAQASAAGQPMVLPHLQLSLAARAMHRSGRPGAATEMAGDVVGALSRAWPRGAAVYALEVVGDAEGLAAWPAGSVAALRGERLAAIRASDPRPLLSIGRRFQAAGRRFEAAETLAAASLAAVARGDRVGAGRMLDEAATQLERMGAAEEGRVTRAALDRLTSGRA